MKDIRKEIRISKEDLELIEHKAKLCNMSFSEYMRKSAVEQIILVKNFEEYKTIIFEMNKIGININQIIKLANTTKYVDRNEVIKLQESLNELADYVYKL